MESFWSPVRIIKTIVVFLFLLSVITSVLGWFMEFVSLDSKKQELGEKIKYISICLSIPLAILVVI